LWFCPSGLLVIAKKTLEIKFDHKSVEQQNLQSSLHQLPRQVQGDEPIGTGDKNFRAVNN